MIPSWKGQTEFDDKYKKVCAIVGLAAAASGTVMSDFSEHKYCITANKNGLSDEYLEVLDSIQKNE